MKISVKGRYALVTMTYLGMNYPNTLSTTTISEKLGLSKIYLEQVLSLLKRAKLVNSEKGANGGYSLAKPMKQISSYDILYAIETNLFSITQSTSSNEYIELALKDLIFKKIDNNLITYLQSITLDILVSITISNNKEINMYYI
jgi:Rrf2 family protein